MVAGDRGKQVASSDVEAAARRLASSPKPSGKTPMSPQRRKAILGSVSRWSGTAVLLVGSLMLFSAAGGISAADDAEIALGAKPVVAAQERIDTAQASLGELPEVKDIERVLERAQYASDQISGIQNDYLDLTGSISIKDIPKTYKPSPASKPKKRSEKERHELAVTKRADALSDLGQQMKPYLSREAQDDEGFDASGIWHDSISSLPDTQKVSLKDHSWSSPTLGIFDTDSSVKATWLLHDGERLVGWVTAVYDPRHDVFDDLRIGTIEGVK